MGSIRTLLALSVVFAHTPFLNGAMMVGGENAVRLFYVASGYVISLVLASDSYRSLMHFYLNRWLRLWPIYAAVGVALIVVRAIIADGFALYHQLSLPALSGVLAANVTLLGQDWLFFLPNNPPLHQGLINAPSWTLGVEISFYLVAPFVLRRRALLIILLGLSLGLRVLLVSAGFKTDPWTYRFFPTELAWFLCGALAHQVLAPLYRRTLGSAAPRASEIAVAAFAVLLCVFPVIPLSNVAGAALLLSAFIVVAPLALEFQNSHAWDRHLGEFSYPIYIGHFLILVIVSYFGAKVGISSPEAVTVAVLGGAVLLAWVLNTLVGRPLEALRRRVRSSGASAPYMPSSQHAPHSDASASRHSPATFSNC